MRQIVAVIETAWHRVPGPKVWLLSMLIIASIDHVPAPTDPYKLEPNSPSPSVHLPPPIESVVPGKTMKGYVDILKPLAQKNLQTLIRDARQAAIKDGSFGVGKETAEYKKRRLQLAIYLCDYSPKISENPEHEKQEGATINKRFADALRQAVEPANSPYFKATDLAEGFSINDINLNPDKKYEEVVFHATAWCRGFWTELHLMAPNVKQRIKVAWGVLLKSIDPLIGTPISKVGGGNRGINKEAVIPEIEAHELPENLVDNNRGGGDASLDTPKIGSR